MFWDVSKQKVKSFALLLTSFITVRLVLISNVKLFNPWLILHICHWILTKYLLRDSSVFPLFFFILLLKHIQKNYLFKLIDSCLSLSSSFIASVNLLILFRRGTFPGCSQRPPSLKSVTHILQRWNLADLYLN